MLSTIAVIAVLGGLIFFHELGHFLVAKSFGMGVKTFSLGFGPKLAGFTSGQTEYKLSLVPLGGYVSLAGESPDEETPEGFSEGQMFMARPAWQRLLVVAAGPVFNFILGGLIYWMLFMAQGQVTMFEPEVMKVMPGSPAMEAGIQPGEVVTAINGRELYFPDTLMLSIMLAGDKPIELTLDDGAGERSLTLIPRFLEDQELPEGVMPRPMIGVSFTQNLREMPLGYSLGIVPAVNKTWAMLTMTIKSFARLIDGSIPLKAVGGPIMIAEVVGKQAHSGLVELLMLAAFISIHLGLINLLPIPVLDGGHIIFFGFEALSGRKVHDSVRKVATAMGLTFIMALMGLAFYNDIFRLLS